MLELPCVDTAGSWSERPWSRKGQKIVPSVEGPVVPPK